MKKMLAFVLTIVLAVTFSSHGYALTVTPEHIEGKAGEPVILEVTPDDGGPVAIEITYDEKKLPILRLDATAVGRGGNADNALANPPIYRYGYVRHTDDTDVEPVGPAEYYLVDYDEKFKTFVHTNDEHTGNPPSNLDRLEMYRGGNQEACVYSYNTRQNVGLGYIIADYVGNHAPGKGSFTGKITYYPPPGSGPRYSMIGDGEYYNPRVVFIGVDDDDDYLRFDPKFMELMHEQGRATVSGPSYTSSGGQSYIYVTSIKSADQKVVVVLEEGMTEIELTAVPKTAGREIEELTVPVTIYRGDDVKSQDRKIYWQQKYVHSLRNVAYRALRRVYRLEMQVRSLRSYTNYILRRYRR